ncbi:MAG: hypothetical protein ABII16_00985 [Patescibacteria group bacterium]
MTENPKQRSEVKPGDEVLRNNLKVFADFLGVVKEMVDTSDQPELVIKNAEAALKEAFHTDKPDTPSEPSK